MGRRPAVDALVVGAGLSGQSLMLHLLRRPTGVRRIVLVDPAPLRPSDAVWAGWCARPRLVDEITARSWSRVAVHAGRERELDIAPYRYRLVRARDLATLTRQALSLGEVEVVPGYARELRETADAVEVVLDSGRVVRGRWAFDSRPATDPAGARLRFTGRHVVAERAVFAPTAVRLLDFRTPQRGGVRFVYTLPFDERTALVEHTAFSAGPAAGAVASADARAEHDLSAYLSGVLGVGVHAVTGVETGEIPLHLPGPRRRGDRTLVIGAAAGLVKASTGYGFEAIQRDSEAVAASLTRRGHPFALPRQRARHRWLDRVFLDVLTFSPEALRAAFDAMFTPGRVASSLRFLDEDTSLADELRLVAALPWTPFIDGALRRRPSRR